MTDFNPSPVAGLAGMVDPAFGGLGALAGAGPLLGFAAPVGLVGLLAGMSKPKAPGFYESEFNAAGAPGRVEIQNSAEGGEPAFYQLRDYASNILRGLGGTGGDNLGAVGMRDNGYVARTADGNLTNYADPNSAIRHIARYGAERGMFGNKSVNDVDASFAALDSNPDFGAVRNFNIDYGRAKGDWDAIMPNTPFGDDALNLDGGTYAQRFAPQQLDLLRTGGKFDAPNVPGFKGATVDPAAPVGVDVSFGPSAGISGGGGGIPAAPSAGIPAATQKAAQPMTGGPMDNISRQLMLQRMLAEKNTLF